MQDLTPTIMNPYLFGELVSRSVTLFMVIGPKSPFDWLTLLNLLDGSSEKMSGLSEVRIAHRLEKALLCSEAGQSIDEGWSEMQSQGLCVVDTLAAARSGPYCSIAP